MFEHVEPYAGDPIFALVDAFTLTRGRTRQSVDRHLFRRGRRLPVLPSVREAERMLAAGGRSPICRWRARRARAAGAAVRRRA
jgi:hypothetical protein